MISELERRRLAINWAGVLVPDPNDEDAVLEIQAPLEIDVWDLSNEDQVELGRRVFAAFDMKPPHMTPEQCYRFVLADHAIRCPHKFYRPIPGGFCWTAECQICRMVIVSEERAMGKKRGKAK